MGRHPKPFTASDPEGSRIPIKRAAIGMRRCRTESRGGRPDERGVLRSLHYERLSTVRTQAIDREEIFSQTIYRTLWGFLAADAEAAPACKPPSKQQAAPRVNGTSDREQLLIRVSALSAATGMSPRYWQRRITRCEVPGARALCLGRRKLYFVDWEIFETWWQQQLRPIPSCPRTSRSAAASGGTGCGTRGKISRDPSKQRTLRLLKSALSKLGKT